MRGLPPGHLPDQVSLMSRRQSLGQNYCRPPSLCVNLHVRVTCICECAWSPGSAAAYDVLRSIGPGGTDFNQKTEAITAAAETRGLPRGQCQPELRHKF